MRGEQLSALRTLLVSVIPANRMSSHELDAMIQYIADVTKTEDEAIRRLSTIVQTDLGGVQSMRAAMHVELMQEKVSAIAERVRELERQVSPKDSLKILQAIFIAISFIASTVALLKAFGLLKLPWAP